ncbi:MAG: hypothetical protein TREMPRED_005119 [Tremellales sp. Tagirdzhanova-0007]|nr:MAG: hypothetical protein TREMPRED_005119 [Tremellales sp. Tagirdzhanova-0007]
MSSDKQQLIAMGFDPARIDWALKATKNAGLQPAMDHLLENSDNAIPDPSTQISSGTGGDDLDEDDQDAVTAHIKKMGGTVTQSDLVPREFEESTEEIKPLTDEEKKAKLQELREKLAQKRAVQGKEDAKSNKANEALRRKAGQDSGKIKEDLQLKEAQKDADKKKRDKMEDQKARAAIKAQIETDKRERAEKTAREKAIRDGGSSASNSSVVGAAPAKPAVAVKSSEAVETRLQVRLSGGGTPLTKTFASDSTLIDVAEWVASESLAYDVSTVTFASTFPRKTFSRAEMSRSLKDNGLTPSAVLMAS